MGGVVGNGGRVLRPSKWVLIVEVNSDDEPNKNSSKLQNSESTPNDETPKGKGQAKRDPNTIGCIAPKGSGKTGMTGTKRTRTSP
jgi:hypothetical protein